MRKNQILCGLEPGGVWTGTGAQMMGLSGAVADDHFRSLYEGYSANGKVKLAHNAGSKSKKRPRRKARDLVFAPDKSVSVLAAWASPEFGKLVVGAHVDATKKSMRMFEEVAGATRRDREGKTLEASPFTAALFTELTNRALEPHLHTHAVLFNIAIRSDGTFGSLESLPLYQWKTIIQGVYQKILAENLRELGLEVKELEFATIIPAVPRDLCKALSTRREEIKRDLKESGYKSPAAARIAQVVTRAAKTDAPEDLLKKWHAIGKQFKFGPREADQLLKDAIKNRIQNLSKGSQEKSLETPWFRKQGTRRVKVRRRPYGKIIGPSKILGYDIRLQWKRVIRNFHLPSIRILYPRSRHPYSKVYKAIENPFVKISIEKKRVFPRAWGRDPLSKVALPAPRIQIKPWALNGIKRLPSLTAEFIEKRREERQRESEKRRLQELQKQTEKQQEQSKTK